MFSKYIDSGFLLRKSMRTYIFLSKKHDQFYGQFMLFYNIGVKLPFHN